MTTAAIPRPLLIPTGDRRPVELAVVGSVLDEWDPEMYLGFMFQRPDGGCTLWHGWTSGGPELGDTIDAAALAAGLDAADWLHIGDRHSTITHRGALRIEAYPLRPVHADVLSGERSPQARRDGLLRVLDTAAALAGDPVPHRHERLPAWLGFGPARLDGRSCA